MIIIFEKRKITLTVHGFKLDLISPFSKDLDKDVDETFTIMDDLLTKVN